MEDDEIVCGTQRIERSKKRKYLLVAKEINGLFLLVWQRVEQYDVFYCVRAN